MSLSEITKAPLPVESLADFFVSLFPRNDEKEMEKKLIIFYNLSFIFKEHNLAAFFVCFYSQTT